MASSKSRAACSWEAGETIGESGPVTESSWGEACLGSPVNVGVERITSSILLGPFINIIYCNNTQSPVLIINAPRLPLLRGYALWNLVSFVRELGIQTGQKGTTGLPSYKACDR